jgi:hypothetical protein
VGGYYTDGAPGLDLLDKLSQATGNAQAPDRESLLHACIWKATIVLFSRYKVAYERKRKIMRNVASIAELKKSFFEIDKVENREDLGKLRVKGLAQLGPTIFFWNSKTSQFSARAETHETIAALEMLRE